MASNHQADLKTEATELRDCVAMLDEAMRSEGIDAHTPLGVWCKAQQTAMISLGELVELQTVRVEERAEVMAKAWQAQTELHNKAIEELRIATQSCRAETARSEERRKAEGQVLAGEIAADIKQAIKDTMVVREVRWNRRQNWMAAAIAAVVLAGFFVGGGLWTGYTSDQGAVRRCLAKPFLDPAGRQYCPMDVVRGTT